MQSRKVGLGALAAALAMACGDDDSGSSNEAQACEDTAAAVASAAQRCGQEYQANYDAFVDVAAGGDCDNIVQVRDRAALYDECIPSFETLSCDALTAGDLPESCYGQLLR